MMKIQLELIPSDELLCECQSSQDDKLYVISKGECQVSVIDRFDVKVEEYTVTQLKAGEMFGEISMLYNCKKSANVKTINYLTCGTLNRKQY